MSRHCTRVWPLVQRLSCFFSTKTLQWSREQKSSLLHTFMIIVSKCQFSVVLNVSVFQSGIKYCCCVNVWYLVHEGWEHWYCIQSRQNTADGEFLLTPTLEAVWKNQFTFTCNTIQKTKTKNKNKHCLFHLEWNQSKSQSSKRRSRHKSRRMITLTQKLGMDTQLWIII